MLISLIQYGTGLGRGSVVGHISGLCSSILDTDVKCNAVQDRMVKCSLFVVQPSSGQYGAVNILLYEQ